MALGAARRGRGHRAAAPTWTGAGTCGPGDVRLGIGPRGSFPRLPPPPAPHLRAVLQSLLDRQLVDPRHRGGGRATAGDAAAAHGSHAEPPTAADPDPPSLAVFAAVPPAPPSPGARRSGGKSRPFGIHAPPPGALIGSRRRLSARRADPGEGLLASPGSAARPGSADTRRARSRLGVTGAPSPIAALASRTRASSEDHTGQLGAALVLPQHFPSATMQEALLLLPSFSVSNGTFPTLPEASSLPLQHNGAGHLRGLWDPRSCHSPGFPRSFVDSRLYIIFLDIWISDYSA